MVSIEISVAINCAAEKKSKAGYPITEWRVREQINKANYRSAPLHVSHASPLRCAACNVRLDRPRCRRRRRRRFHVAGERVRLFRGDRRSNFHALQRRTVQGLFLDCGQAVTRIRARFPVSKSSSVVVDRRSAAFVYWNNRGGGVCRG